MRRDHKGHRRQRWQDVCMLAVLGVFVSFALPSYARGDARQFIPKIFDYSGEAGFEGYRESVENTVNGRGFKTSDTLLAEKITLTADGYSYDPRFVLFHLKLAGDVKEEWFNTSDFGSSTTVKFLPEYEFRTMILAEHPYNLELYVQRFTPFLRSQVTLAPDTVVDDYGAIFRYKKKPLFLTLQYDDTSYSTNKDTRDARTYSAHAVYLIKRFTNSFRYSHKDSTASQNNQTVTGDIFSYDHQLVIGPARLSGDASYSKSAQIIPLLSNLDTSRFNWVENLTYALPWNFDSSAYYSYTKDSMKTGATADSQASEDFNSSNSAGFNLTHRLFRSVVTSFNYNVTSSKSSAGNQTSGAYSLMTVYSKRTFFGTMALSGYFNESTLDRKGTLLVLDEVYGAQLFGEFNLNQQNVDQTSIIVRVVSPTTGVLVDLRAGINYTVLLVGTRTMIRIMSLPADVLSPDPLFTYEFHVSYSPLSGDFKIQTPSYGFSLRLGLFNNLVSPYFSYDRTSQKLVSGVFPGIPEDANKMTVGVLIAKNPYSFQAEYQTLSSRFNPSKRFLVQFGYNANIFKTVSLTARLHYEYRRDVVTDITTGGTVSLTSGTERPTDSYGGELGIEKRFTNTNLTFSVFSSYTATKDIDVKTDSFTLNSNLTWAVGNLDLRAGAEVSRVTSESFVGSQKETRDYYYFQLKRKLF